MIRTGDICNREVVTATPRTTAREAARLMRARHVGTLVVVDHDEGARRPVGIVTDRDLVVGIMALDIEANDMTVGEIMTHVVTAGEDVDIHDALQTMRRKAVRRLPVVSARGHLIGIVSIDDLLKILGEEIAALAVIAPREHARETAQRSPV